MSDGSIDAGAAEGAACGPPIRSRMGIEVKARATAVIITPCMHSR